MSKIIVITSGKFSLIDMSQGAEIHYNRPTVVKTSNFLQSRAALGQVKVLVDNLPNEATDEDFVKALTECDGDVELALQAYKAEFQEVEEVEAPAKEVEAPAKKAPAKKAPAKK